MEINKQAVFSGHQDGVYALCKKDDNHFFSAAGDGMLILWDMQNPDEGEVVARLPQATYSLVYMQEKEILIAGTRFGNLYAFDLKNRKLLKQASLPGDIFKLSRIPDKGTIMAAMAGGHFCFFDEDTLEIKTAYHPVNENARAIALSHSGKIAATGWSDHHIRIYDTDTFKEIFAFPAHQNSVFALAFTPDDKYLLSGGRDAAIRIWEHEHAFENYLNLPAHWFTVNDIQFSPNGKYFASASRDKSAKIWRTEGFGLVHVIDNKRFEAHSHSVNILLWMGDILITAGDDRQIISWELSNIL